MKIAKASIRKKGILSKLFSTLFMPFNSITFSPFAMCMVLFFGSNLVSFSNDLGGKPFNVILILTDNHSPWTLGCYGNTEILTPNIDRLAREGMLFERSFSSNPVCSPTRATLLTGLIPSQHGVHNYLSAGGAQVGPEAYNTIEEFRSLPEILSESGYVCGLSGKWHLGKNLYPQEGFTYWVTKPHGHTDTFYDAEIIEDGKIRNEPEYLTDFWTDHGIRFIEQNKSQSFFLYLAYNGPYGLGNSLNNPSKNRHMEYYAKENLESFPRNEIHPWLRTNREFVNNTDAMRRYAAEISGIDDGVGRIMDTLKRLGLDSNTLVIFTADQGLCGGHHGMWGMADHSRPLHTFNETLHTPLIWRFPKWIAGGERSDIMVSNYDLFPTLLNFMGVENTVPSIPVLPGRDYSAALLGKKIIWENVVFYEYDNSRMIRTDEWKYTERFPKGASVDELYDLKNDPGEEKNLIHVLEWDEIKNRLQKELYTFFRKYADPKYDLWKKGSSKANLLILNKNE
jgi:arylsulfatase A-like enzyme